MQLATKPTTTAFYTRAGIRCNRSAKANTYWLRKQEFWAPANLSHKPIYYSAAKAAAARVAEFVADYKDSGNMVESHTLDQLRQNLFNIRRFRRHAGHVTPQVLQSMLEGLGFEYEGCPDCGDPLLDATRVIGHSHGEVCASCAGSYPVTYDTDMHIVSHFAYNAFDGTPFEDRDERDDYNADNSDNEDGDRDELADYHGHPRRRTAIKGFAPDGDDPERANKKALKLGVEWEILSSDRMSLSNWLDNNSIPAVAESDGSLDDEIGVEVVTGWSTLHTIKNLMTQIHKHASADGTDGCGIHINVSGLLPTEVAKLVAFYDDVANRNLLSTVAGRYDVDYAMRGDGDSLHTQVRTARYLKDGHPPGEKYRHVNTARHGYVEIRIFKSTVDLNRLLARIEFAWASCQFVRQASAASPLTAQAFLAWFNSDAGVRKACPNLAKRHQSLGFATFTKDKGASMERSKLKKQKVLTVQAPLEQMPAAPLQDVPMIDRAALAALPPIRRSRALRAATLAAR